MTDDLRGQDVIDSRDVIARIEELESERDSDLDIDREEWEEDEGNTEPFDEDSWTWDDEPAQQELDALKSLAEECEGYGDWSSGETLIADTYFEEYAKELAEDCGMIEHAAKWPNYCIDWEWAARELQVDYMSVTFDGTDYWMRA